MNTDHFREELLRVTEQRISNQDVSHDIYHTLRVLRMAERLAGQELEESENLARPELGQWN